ncbi:conserved hypothetical protein [Pediculus humanus corporis]|uniref:Elongation of very long chain fatty acids protein n=1 Tax=Pediculus humanus subsp. corporis TaxID=121224 RepID=E0W383_PEDHC|nr:uncharacterized protein Phum_PHUM601890 [Pediculus humanus corporis]EEB20089.1 conserved hypothetical protein [Pediculus humanus corporis]
MEVTLPNYSYVFNFEQEFAHYETRRWMRENWTYGFYYVGVYMILIFGGQHYMQSRPKYNLRGVLSLWNTLLAGFSIMGACRTAPELLHTLKNYGLYHSDKVSGFWSWMFVLSKLPELGDTIFIVLRKQPLIFLHWYHHITVLLYSWFSYTEYTSSARWFIVMNYCVHSVMYSYYALKSMGYRPYKSIQMIITTLQLIQMVVGCFINLWAYNFINSVPSSSSMESSGPYFCHISKLNIKLSVAMYFSYFVLFSRFFYKNYINKDYNVKEHHSNGYEQQQQQQTNKIKTSNKSVTRGGGVGVGGTPAGNAISSNAIENNYKAKYH